MDAEGYSQHASEGPSTAQTLALRMVGHNQRVLEFGCAAGHVTRLLAEQACSVVGLEVDPRAAQIAEQYADEVLVVDLDTDDCARKLAGREFDVALFGDVLEHLRDPLKVLRSVRQLLAPGTGFVVLSVPNVAHVDVRLALLNGEFEYRPWGLLDESHMRFFTRASLDRLVEQAGLVAVDLERVTFPAFASELGVDQAKVDPAVVAGVLTDPEAETYQFVVKAVPADAVSAVAGLAPRVIRLEDKVRKLEIDRAVEVAHLERVAEEAQRRAAEAALAAEQRVASADTELRALQETRLFRWSAPARRLYTKVRRRLRPPE